MAKSTVGPTLDTGEPASSVWLTRTRQSCEDLSARLVVCERNEARAILGSFTANVPAPGGEVEWLLLRGLLLELALRTSVTLHTRLHRDAFQPCGLQTERLLAVLTTDPPDSTIRQFEVWQRTFCDALDRAHPGTLGSSIGVLVRREYKKRWSLARLARHFKTSPAIIRNAFRRTFGQTVHEYQQTARVVASLEEIRRSKIDAVASEVGYRSRTNFYSAFRRLMNTTPTGYRNLPREKAALLKAVASRRLSSTSTLQRQQSRSEPNAQTKT
jgi:AraC-like DNA-binding protein